MAIQRLRDGTQGIIAKIIVGLIIIAFALFGLGSITTFLVPIPTVASVNGEDITRQQMEFAMERLRQQLASQGNDDPDEDELREDVLEGLITREVLEQTAQDYGFQFGETMLDEEIIQNTAFHLDGRFDAEQFRLVLGRAGYSPLMYRDEFRLDKMLQQMQSGISDSQFVTPAESKRLMSLNEQTRDLAFVRITVDSFFEEVTVTDDEIADWYDDHPDDFVTEETVSLEYIDLQLENLSAEVSVTEDDLQAEYETSKEQYSTEEQRRVSHILVSVDDDRSEEEARTKIEDLAAQLADGGDFEALAREHSDDPGSGAEGGDLGFNGRGTYVPEFEERTWSAPLDEISEPILTQFGFHLIKVTEIEESVTPPFEEIREDLEADYRRRLAEDEFVTLSNDLGELAFEHLDLQVPAEETGLEIQETDALTREAANALFGSDAVVEAALSPDVLLDGNNSDVIEISDERHLVLRVKEHSPSEREALELVQEGIRLTLQTDKAKELAAAKAEEMAEQIKAGSLALFVADQQDLEWQRHEKASRTEADIDLAILTHAFEMPRPAEGKESISHLVLDEGDAVVIRISGVHYPDEADLDENQTNAMARNLEFQLGNIDFFDFEKSRSDAASISID